ncbi:MAG TPA: RNA polymerase sigma-70 factor [Puia sp.]|nr:RNA polymerase sigma-70 factor [Puia sp.]
MAFSSLHNEKIVLRALSAGEERAFRKLYDHYAEKVYSVALLHLKQPELAEDLVQSVFLKLWESRADLGEVQSFAGWFYTLTRNMIISSLRKQGTQASYLDFLRQRQGLLPINPDQDIVRKEQLQLIRRGVQQLSAQQRTAFTLQCDEGLSYKIIGERMGISPNTVRVHLFKAMESLRRFVQTHTDDKYLLLCLYSLASLETTFF